jgi:hypothetical protein
MCMIRAAIAKPEFDITVGVVFINGISLEH